MGLPWPTLPTPQAAFYEKANSVTQLAKDLMLVLTLLLDHSLHADQEEGEQGA
jgi:hypothetical protein